MSDDEVGFLTQKDADKEESVMSLWNDNDKLKLLLVTDGEKGCRYFSKVYMHVHIYIYIFFYN